MSEYEGLVATAYWANNRRGRTQAWLEDATHKLEELREGFDEVTKGGLVGANSQVGRLRRDLRSLTQGVKNLKKGLLEQQKSYFEAKETLTSHLSKESGASGA